MKENIEKRIWKRFFWRLAIGGILAILVGSYMVVTKDEPDWGIAIVGACMFWMLTEFVDTYLPRVKRAK